MDSLLHKCKVNVDKDLAEVILGGALYSSEIRECGLQLIINKGCYIGGCCEALSNASTEVRRLSLEVFETILETGLALAETESLGRKPVTLVLDSAVQVRFGYLSLTVYFSVFSLVFIIKSFLEHCT